MSVNSSSSSRPPSNSSSINNYDFLQSCIDTTACAFNIVAFTITSILLVLPLCIHVIYLGFQQWRQQRSGATMRHSDIFTYHMVVIELMSIIGSTLGCCGVLTRLPVVLMVGLFLFSINVTGQQFFHTLTCVERYLAVVHPITYLGLRTAKGIRIRNISIGCVWLLSFAEIGFQFMENTKFIVILSYCTIAFIFVVVSFCSLSVLYVLTRPGPGAGGEGRQRVDRSKMRAFYTIMVILGVLVFRFGGTVVINALYDSPHLLGSESSTLLMSVMWFALPSSLVLPLLFLHRAGKLLCCKNSNKSGQGSD